MAITRDQTSAFAQVGSGNNVVCIWSTNPTAGSKVLVYVQLNDTVSSVVDNGTTPTTFTLDASSTAGEGAYVYRADNITLPASGNYHVTVNYTPGSGTIQAVGQSYLGVVNGGPTATNTGTATSGSVATGSVTSAAGGALFGAAFSDSSGQNPETISLTSASWNSLAINTNGSSYWCFGAADFIGATGSPDTSQATWSLGDTPTWGAAVAVYEAAGTDSGTGSLALGALHFSATGSVVANRGSIALGALAFHGTASVIGSDRALPDIQVLVDWSNNPLGSDATAGSSWTDISQYVRLDQGVNMSRGRQDNISAVQPGTCTFTVHNDDGRFTPGNSSSPYWPGVAIGRRVQVNVKDEVGAYHTRFDGQIAEFNVVDTATGEDTLMRVMCSDVLAFLNRYPPFSCWTVQECIAMEQPVLQYLMNEPVNSAGLYDTSGSGGPLLTLVSYPSPPFTSIPSGATNAYLSAPTTAFQSGSSPVEGAVSPTTYPGNYANPVTSLISSPLPSVQFGMTMNNATGTNSQARAAPSSQFQGFLTNPVTVGAGKAFTLLGWVWPNGDIITNPYNSTTHEMICLGNSRTGSMLGLEASSVAGTATFQASYYPSYTPTTSSKTTTSGFSSASHIIGNAPFMVAVVVNGTTATFYLGGNLFGEGGTLLTGGTTITIPSGTTFNFLSIGGPLGGGNGFVGNISLVNMFDVALSSAELNALQFTGGQGYFQHGTGDAFGRVTVAYAGLPSYWTGTIDAGLSKLDYADITGANPSTVMQSITAVEHGLFFVDSSGKLNFHDRSRRMGAPSPVLTLPAGSYNTGIQPKVNDQYLVNYAAYQNQRGGQGVVAFDPDSISKYGTYGNGSVASPQTAPYISWAGGWDQKQVATPTSMQRVNQYGTQEIADAASWDANTLAEPAMKLATPTVDILSNLVGQNEYVARSALYGVEINQVISISHNLDWWPNAPESSELFIEGVTESYSDKQATIGFYTSPAIQGRAWIPGDSTYGQLDVTARVGISQGGLLATVYDPAIPTFSTSMNQGAGSRGFVGAKDLLGLYGNLQQQFRPPLLFTQQVKSSQSIAHNSATFIVWDTTLIDTVQAMNQFTNGNTSYVILVSGWYEVCATVNFSNNGTGRRDIMIVQNQTEALRNIAPASCRASSTNATGVSTSAVIWCNQGDAIGVKGYQDSGSPLGTYLFLGGSHLSLRFLGSGSNRN